MRVFPWAPARQAEGSPHGIGLVNVKRRLGILYPVRLDDILYCEARKNYTMVVLKDQKSLMPLIPLSKFELLLQEAGGAFLQIHRSYLVSRRHIRSIASGSVSVGPYELPIGVQFRERFLKAIGMREAPGEG